MSQTKPGAKYLAQLRKRFAIAFAQLRKRYGKASKKQKTAILNELVAMTGY